MGSQENLRRARINWAGFTADLATAGDEKSIFLAFSEAPFILGTSEQRLKDLEGGRFGVDVTENGLWITFSGGINLTVKAYQTAAELLQLSRQGLAGRRISQLEENNPLLFKQLGKVTGFMDLIDSIKSGATPGQEGETVLIHARVASWFAALPAGIRTNLIPPDKIFTQPG